MVLPNAHCILESLKRFQPSIQMRELTKDHESLAESHRALMHKVCLRVSIRCALENSQVHYCSCLVLNFLFLRR